VVIGLKWHFDWVYPCQFWGLGDLIKRKHAIAFKGWDGKKGKHCHSMTRLLIGCMQIDLQRKVVCLFCLYQ
jgi:hypothetical protein